jgi:iron complex outermembrane receptor protein
LNGLNTLTQGVDATFSYPTDFGDMGLINWTLAGNYNTTALSFIAPTPPVFGGSAVTFFSASTLYDFVHSAPSEKISLTADWSFDPFGVTFRETYWGPQHNFTSPTGSAPFIADPQAGVGLTDVELRYSVTDQLQIGIGANNLFNIKPDVVPWDSSAFGPAGVAGSGYGANGSNIVNDPVTTSFDPYGGYYYGRITYNF